MKTLDLSKNNIQNLGQLGTLTALKSLNLDDNDLCSGSLEPVAKLTSLQSLSVARNKLGKSPPPDPAKQQRHSPEALPQLPASLKQLNLSSNELFRIPRSVCSSNLSKLEKLDLSCNSIAALPPEIVNLVNLQDLNLDGNLIVSLPEEIGKLSKLKALSLRDNKISLTSDVFSETNPQPLPKSLFTDTLLIDLNLHGNDMTNTQLNKFEGFEDFLDRRQKVKSKTFANLSLCGLK